MRRRLSPNAILLVGGIAIAACLGNELHLASTTSDATVTTGNGNFGTVLVNTTSAPQTITISPKTSLGVNQNDTVNSVTLNGCSSSFAIVGGGGTLQTIAPGLPTAVYYECQAGGSGSGCPTMTKTYSFAATYAPKSAAPGAGTPETCNVDIYIDGAKQSPELVLTGTAVAPPYDVEVDPNSPAQINFGDQLVRTPAVASSPSTITIKNLGSLPVTINSVTVSAATGGTYAFSAGNQSSHTLAAASSETDAVTCTPTAVGGVSGGTLSVATTGTGSGAGSSSTAMIALKCNGIMSSLAFEPSLVTFATRQNEPQTQHITMQNIGTAGIKLTSFSLTGSSEVALANTPAANTILTAGTIAGTLESCTDAPTSCATMDATYSAASVRPAPTALGTIIVDSDGIDTDGVTDTGPLTPRNIQMMGDSLMTTISISAIPNNMDNPFPDVCVGTTGSPVQFAITANSDGAIVVNGVTSSDPTQFVVTAVQPTAAPTAGSGYTLNGDNGPALLFDVAVKPTAAGLITGTLTLTTDMPLTPTQTIDVSATALAAGVTASPMALDFGVADARQTTSGLTVAVTNCDAGALTITSAVISGIDAGDFILVQQPTGPIAAGTNGQYIIAMQAQHNGTRTASLVLTYDGGTQTIALSGQGAGIDDPTTTTQTGTYYTCSAGGHGGAWWPIGLVALVLLRRRRRARR